MPNATDKIREAFEETRMKRYFGYALILALLSVPAFAAKNSKTVTLSGNVKIGSTALPAGSYRVTWTGSGTDVQVTLAQNGKTLATVPAKVVDEKHSLTGVTTSTQSGVDFLQAIQLDSISLVFQTPTASGQ
jgi:hypothetical protein